MLHAAVRAVHEGLLAKLGSEGYIRVAASACQAAL